MTRTPLAWKNLTAQPVRTAVSIGGIGFAILLMFMQLGFLGAVGTTATQVYKRLPVDLVVRSPEFQHVFDARRLPDDVARQVAAMPEVADVQLLQLGQASWQNPNNQEFRAVAVIGIDPQRNPLALPEVDRQSDLLMREDLMLIDRTSSPDLGPRNERAFGSQDVGVTTQVTGKRMTIAGTFEMGTGLAANGQVIVSRRGFQRIVPGADAEHSSMILVHLRPEYDADQVAATMTQRLWSAGGELARAQVLTKEQAITAERKRWYFETPVGVIFGMGVALAVIVGGVICYMVLAADVLAHLPEYATLKAIGYSNGFLGKVLLAQAAILAGMAMPPAILTAIGLYAVTSHVAGLPIEMTLPRIALVAGLSLLMCSVAGLMALRKLSKAEPANLF